MSSWVPNQEVRKQVYKMKRTRIQYLIHVAAQLSPWFNIYFCFAFAYGGEDKEKQKFLMNAWD